MCLIKGAFVGGKNLEKSLYTIAGLLNLFVASGTSKILVCMLAA